MKTGSTRVEFETTIRGRRVRCWLEDGRAVGDRELVDRLSHFRHDRTPLQAASLADLIHQAVGSEVTIRVNGSDLTPGERV